jgi:SpoVK/Ycf46/Vps4 family AAA+-type ATPase
MDWEKTRKALNDSCLKMVSEIGKGIYFPSIYEQNRNAVMFVELLTGDKAGLFYIAPSGSGKTNLFCALATSLSEVYGVYFIKLSMPLPQETSLNDYICKDIKRIADVDLDENFDKIREELTATGKKIVLLIDGIDECLSMRNTKNALHYTLTHLAKGPIKIFLNCRTSQWKNLSNPTWLQSFQIVKWQPDDESALFRDPVFQNVLGKYFEHYAISATMLDKANDVCRYPMMLRMFCEAYKGKQLDEVDTVRYLYMYIRLIANIAHIIINKQPEQTIKSVVGAIEAISKKFWKNGSYIIEKNVLFDNDTDSLNITEEFYAILVENLLIKEYQVNGCIVIEFYHQLITEYLIANSMLKSMLWADKPNQALAEELVSFVKEYQKNDLLIPVLEFLYLIFEMVGKHQVMITLFMKKDFDSSFKKMLCRAASRMGQIDIETWKMLRILDSIADHDIKNEVDVAVTFLGENIPGDQVFHCLMLLQNDNDTSLQKEIIARLKYDSQFQMFIKQLQPYSKSIEIQQDIISFLNRIKLYNSQALKLPIINLIEFILQFDKNSGSEQLLSVSDWTKNDTAFLDAWVHVACNHAGKIYTLIIKKYIDVVKNDRLVWDRIVRFCINGGMQDTSSALKLICQGFESINNMVIVFDTLTFVSEFGFLDPDSSQIILMLAGKKARFLSASKQMELREKVAESAIFCFRKNNRAFVKIIKDIATSEDQKIREIVIKELKKKND